MAYLQRTRILSDSDLDDGVTYRERLDLSGKVTCIELKIDCNRYTDRANGAVVYTLADCISRIELLRDATSPLISLTGEQLDAMNYWDLGRPNARRYLNFSGASNILHLYLLGGRDFYDREYGWDFDRLSKVYLEYTYHLHEGTAEYFAANDHDIKIYAWQWKGDNVPSFRGFMRSKQLDAWTTTATDAEHKVEIPSTYPIRRVGFQGKTRASTIGGTVTKLELQVDKGAYSPVIVSSPMDWCMAEVSEYGLVNRLGGIDYMIAASSMDLPYWFSYYETVDVVPYASDQEDIYVLGLVTAPARAHQITSEAGRFCFSVAGWGFQKCLRIGFDHEPDGFDLLRVPGGKALDLICTEAAASKSAAVFVQDVVSY